MRKLTSIFSLAVVVLLTGCLKDPNEKIPANTIGVLYFDSDSANNKSVLADNSLRIPIRLTIADQSENGKKVQFSVTTGKLLDVSNVSAQGTSQQVQVTIVNNDAIVYFNPPTSSQPNCLLVASIDGVNFIRSFNLVNSYPESIFLYPQSATVTPTEDVTIKASLVKPTGMVSENIQILMQPTVLSGSVQVEMDKPYYTSANDNGTVSTTAILKNLNHLAGQVSVIAVVIKNDGTKISSAATTVTFQ